jgi:hypothetical protein
MNFKKHTPLLKQGVGIQVTNFWVMVPCSEDGDSVVLWTLVSYYFTTPDHNPENHDKSSSLENLKLHTRSQ